MKQKDPFTIFFVFLLAFVVVIAVIAVTAASQYQQKCAESGGMVVKTHGGDKCVQLTELNPKK